MMVVTRFNNKHHKHIRLRCFISLVFAFVALNLWLGGDDADYADGSFIRKLLVSTSQGNNKGRIAIVRPVGSKDEDINLLMESFGLWDVNWPCNHYNGTHGYAVDLYVSFSRDAAAAAAVNPDNNEEEVGEGGNTKKLYDWLSTKLNANRNWNGCFDNFHVINAQLSESKDKYAPNSEQDDLLWVNGPNQQFTHAFREIQKKGIYDGMFLMEHDVQPRTSEWLDKMVKEIDDNRPVALMGSKYKGHSWDKFRDQMPKALLDHINGNAFYNVTHPLMDKIIGELEWEQEHQIYYNAIPYDYRISQIITEGATGIPPDFPFPDIKVKDKDTEEEKNVVLEPKTTKFKYWWDTYGSSSEYNKDGEPVKESKVISNFAATNYLMKHVQEAGDMPMVHGKGTHNTWNPETHNITLVITDYNEHLDKDILSQLDLSKHPFSEVVVMYDNIDQEEKESSSHKDHVLPNNTPVRFVDRSFMHTIPAYMDVCDAPVNTDWFMLTNVYHTIANDIDLIFTNEPIPKPVVSFTPANTRHCTDYEACRQTIRLAREIYPSADKIVLDLDMLYHTSSRDAFCDEWKSVNGYDGFMLDERERNNAGHDQMPHGPTATSYVASLFASGVAENIYSFSDVLIHGSKNVFERIDEKTKSSSSEQQTNVQETYLMATRRRLISFPTGLVQKLYAIYYRIFGGVPLETKEDVMSNSEEEEERTLKRGGQQNTCSAGLGESCRGNSCCIEGYGCSRDKICLSCAQYGGSINGCRRRLSLSSPGLLVADENE